MKLLFESAALLAAVVASLFLLGIALAGGGRTVLRFAGILASLLFFVVASSLSSIGPYFGMSSVAIQERPIFFSSLGGLLYLGLAPGLYHELLDLPSSKRQTWVYGALFGASLTVIFLGGAAKEGPALIGLSLILFGEIAWGLGLAMARYRSLGSALPRRFLKRFFLVSALFFPALAMDSVGSAAGFDLLGPFDDLSLPSFLLAVSALVLLEGRRWTRPLHPPLDAAEGALTPAATVSGRALTPAGSALVQAMTASGEALTLAATVSGGALTPAALTPAEEAAGVGVGSGSWNLLSPRETEIAGLILGGASAKEIAITLGISSKTAENHTYRIFQKVGARNRLQLYRILGSH